MGVVLWHQLLAGGPVGGVRHSVGLLNVRLFVLSSFVERTRSSHGQHSQLLTARITATLTTTALPLPLLFLPLPLHLFLRLPIRHFIAGRLVLTQVRLAVSVEAWFTALAGQHLLTLSHSPLLTLHLLTSHPLHLLTSHPLHLLTSHPHPLTIHLLPWPCLPRCLLIQTRGFSLTCHAHLSRLLYDVITCVLPHPLHERCHAHLPRLLSDAITCALFLPHPVRGRCPTHLTRGFVGEADERRGHTPAQDVEVAAQRHDRRDVVFQAQQAKQVAHARLQYQQRSLVIGHNQPLRPWQQVGQLEGVSRRGRSHGPGVEPDLGQAGLGEGVAEL